jgi:putative transposase
LPVSWAGERIGRYEQDQTRLSLSFLSDGRTETASRPHGSRCVRYVYNWALDLRQQTYRETGKGLSYKALDAQMTIVRHQEATSFLSGVSCVPLQQSLRHLMRAYSNFFDGRAQFPTFKKRQGPQSATYTRSAFSYKDGTLTLAKMEQPLAIVWSRPLPDGAQPSTVTVSRDQAGRYFVSILVEEEITPLAPKEPQIGIDLGLKVMVATSAGETYENPKYAARTAKKLARAQRKLAHKQKGSKNREKQRLRVAKIHARIADRRKHSQHQLSTKLIRSLPAPQAGFQTIVVESLAVKNMLQHPTLAKAIADVGWRELVRQLEYKAAWYGRTLIKIDRFWFYP